MMSETIDTVRKAIDEAASDTFDAEHTALQAEYEKLYTQIAKLDLKEDIEAMRRRLEIAQPTLTEQTAELAKAKTANLAIFTGKAGDASFGTLTGTATAAPLDRAYTMNVGNTSITLLSDGVMSITGNSATQS